MATPMRRSSRLRGSSAQPQPDTPSIAVSPKLETLQERSEPQIQTSVATTPKTASKLPRSLGMDAPGPQSKTPMTTGRIQPDREEMHPAKFQLTANKITSAKRLGIATTNFEGSPTNRNSAAASQLPLQQNGSQPFTTTTFDFRAPRETSVGLSSDAQRMMDELRANAARYKEEIKKQQEGSEEHQRFNALLGRKLATPKSKSGRFSDVHLKEFHKMDSIANHASSFRADLSRLTPAKSLKRSNSKAGFDEDSTPQRTPSRKTPMTAPAGPPVFRSIKRVKTKDISKEKEPSALSSLPRSNSGLPRPATSSNLLTPTKSSLARSNSAKSLVEPASLSKIPSLARVPSIKTLGTPSKPETPSSKMVGTPSKPAETPVKPSPAPSKIPQTENSVRFRDTLASKLQNVKSILRRPQIRFSDDPAKIAAGTHVATPKSHTPAKAQEKTVADLPKEPGSPAHRAEKHVEFTASTNLPVDNVDQQWSPGTPSPTKKTSLPGGLRPSVIGYPTLPAATGAASNPPSSPTPVYSQPARPVAPASASKNFTFRVGSNITFSSPLKPNTPSIRHVSAHAAPATTSRLPGGMISHGLPNKKRKHDSTPEEDSEKENDARGAEVADGSPVKRRKVGEPSGPPTSKKLNDTTSVKPTAAQFSKRMSAVPSSKIDRKNLGNSNKKGLSMARLNALAAPKKR